MHHLTQLNFYITDRCDLACDHCITFNNFAWGQHRNPSDDLSELQAWADILAVDEICVLGGEATLNPWLSTWVRVITELWPQSRRRITTNGRHLDRCEAAWFEQGWDLEVAAHSLEDFARARAWAEATWPQCVITEGHLSITGDLTVLTVRVQQRVVMEITLSIRFMPWPWHQSAATLKWDQLRDPAIQRSHCEVADCSYMVGSRLYRCPIQAVLPQISHTVQQPWHKLAAEDLGVAVHEDVAAWFDQLPLAQSQCSLCAWKDHGSVTVTQTRKFPIRVVEHRGINN
jgi:hypothetical protein